MKKIEHFNKATAEKLGLDLKLVKQVNSFYWKEVKRYLSRAEYNAVFLKNIGTFAISKKKINMQISKEILRIRRLRALPTLGIRRKAILNGKIENLKKLLIRRNELAIFYTENKRNWSKPKL